ncbi:hypothetical protein CAter282_4334 [Collimonas arenae]|uniref:Uncharacterized protein n=1 Tax=Collimonas arenae TaxID=279058 RepID=A0A127QPT4_9BURK|nr:hypothetical protein CAter282_4334 [Collimonas arenae]
MCSQYIAFNFVANFIQRGHIFLLTDIVHIISKVVFILSADDAVLTQFSISKY